MKKLRLERKGLLIKFLKWMYSNEDTEFNEGDELMIEAFLKEIDKK